MLPGGIIRDRKRIFAFTFYNSDDAIIYSTERLGIARTVNEAKTNKLCMITYEIKREE